MPHETRATIRNADFYFIFQSLVITDDDKLMNVPKDRKYSVKVAGKKYNVVLHSDAEDGGYRIECQALPGCASQGETVEEALEMIKDAIEGYLEVSATRNRLKKAS